MAEAVVDDGTQVLVGPRQGAAEQRQVLGEPLDRARRVDLAVQDRVAVAEEDGGDVEVVVGDLDEQVPESIIMRSILYMAATGSVTLVCRAAP